MKFRPFLLLALFLVVAVLSLAVHFEIYRQTSASAFINRPEYYYYCFVIRDRNRQSIGEVSMAAGLGSYATAALSLGCLCGCAVNVLWTAIRKRDREDAAANRPA